MKNIDKNSPVPLYYQLYNGILKDIKDGVLKPGDMIPTEASLQKKYDLSRATVRHALVDLAKEGYVERIKSKGTVVKNRTYSFGYHHVGRGFSAMSQGLGIVELVSVVLAAEVVDPDIKVKETLQLIDGEKVFHLKRLRGVENKPSVIAEDWIDYKQCMGIESVDFNKATLFDMLENVFGINIKRMERTFECSYIDDEEEMKLLKVRKNDPLLRCTNRVFDNSDKPVIYSKAIINGSYTVIE